MDNVHISNIHVKENIRSNINKDSFNNLKNAIKEQGIINPIHVDKDYNIICGHRRFKALKELNIKQVPVILHNNISKIEVLKLQLQEDIQKEDIPLKDKRKAIKKLIELVGKNEHKRNKSYSGVTAVSKMLGICNNSLYRILNGRKVSKMNLSISKDKGLCERFTRIQKNNKLETRTNTISFLVDFYEKNNHSNFLSLFGGR